MKLLGSLMIAWGGYGWWRVCVRERNVRQQMLERLLGALHRLREDIRMVRLPIPQLLEELGDEEPFFAAVLTYLRQREDLAESWAQAAEELPLSSESRRVWCWLGGQLTGDEAGVLRALDYGEQELERDRQKLYSQRREADRSTAVVCFSAAAFLVILLL